MNELVFALHLFIMKVYYYIYKNTKRNLGECIFTIISQTRREEDDHDLFLPRLVNLLRFKMEKINLLSFKERFRAPEHPQT